MVDLDITRIGSLSSQEINAAVSRLVLQAEPTALALELLEDHELFTELIEHIAAVQSGGFSWIGDFAHATDAASFMSSLGEESLILDQLAFWMVQPERHPSWHVVGFGDDEGLTRFVCSVATSPIAADLTAILVKKNWLSRRLAYDLTNTWRNSHGNPNDDASVAALAAMHTDTATAVLAALVHDSSSMPLARCEHALNRQPTLLMSPAVIDFAFDLATEEIYPTILDLGLHTDTVRLLGEWLRDDVAANELLTEVNSARTTDLFHRLAQTSSESLTARGIASIIDAMHSPPGSSIVHQLIKHTLGEHAWHEYFRDFQPMYLETRSLDQDRAESLLKEQLERTGVDIGRLMVLTGVLAAAKTVIGVVGSMAQPLIFAGAIAAVAEAIRVDDSVRDHDKIRLVELPSDAIVVNRALRDRAFMPYYELFEYDGQRDWLFACLPRFDDSIATTILEDLVPWVSSWPAEELQQLRYCLEYELVHDHQTWTQQLLNAYLPFGVEPIEEVMRPFWDGVFGGQPSVRPMNEYRVLSVDQGIDVIKNFDPGQPDWPWMETVDGFENELRLAQLVYVSVTDDRHGKATETDEKSVQHQGLIGLNHARRWHDQAIEGTWSPPTDGLPIPLAGVSEAERRAAHVLSVGTYCSDEKINGLDSKYRELYGHSFLELRAGLEAAAAGLGMHCGIDLERGIEEARELEAVNTTPYRCWEAWAVIAASLLKAEQTDRYLHWRFGRFATAEQQQAFRERVVASE